MNPLPGIQKACETIDKGLGKYADLGKREVAWGLVRDVVEKWRPAPIAAPDAQILADAVSAECPASADAIPEAVTAAVAQLVKEVTPYPKEAKVKIDGMCPNPRLMAGTLVGDGRRVSVWTSRGRQFRIYAEVACKLDVVRGDEAIYLPT